MIIAADEQIPYLKDYFGALGELHLYPGRTMSSADVREADMLLVRSITPVNQTLLKGSRVKFVGSVTAGADHLDTDWLCQADIAWCVVAGFNAPPVADYVVSVLAALRRNGVIESKPLRAAVIGVGNVGSLVVKRLTILGFKVILCDPFRAEQEADFEGVSLDNIADVDLITVHVPLTKTGPHPTRHFINKAFLERQKPGCILLNSSRGSVIHTKDLLAHGKHLHWCFDVWENEPHIDRHVLEQALIATPHIAGYSVQSKMRGTAMLYQLACTNQQINSSAAATIKMPEHQLNFATAEYAWHDIVLGVFNPLIISTMMRTLLVTPDKTGLLFDNMRQQFNYRHEFAFTKIAGAKLSVEDAAIVKQLGLVTI